LSEPVFTSTFLAYLRELSLTSGRIKFVIKDAPADVAQAATLAYVLDKVLDVTVYQGTGTDPVCSFAAIIPRIQRALHFAGNVGQVHFEVAETSHRDMIRLMGHEEKVLRLEVGISDGAIKHAKQPKEKASKGGYGMFWNYLCKHGFMSHSDMLEIFNQLRHANHRPDTYDSSQLLRDSFGVESRAAISPAALREWLRVRRLPEQSSAWTMIDQAEGTR